MTVALRDVWKGYPRLGESRSSRRLLLSRFAGRSLGPTPRWALRGVSLDAASGEFVGLIGGNGSGKSSLLRLASGLGRPTRGTVDSPPGAAAVLALGETFDPELSGRENAITASVVAGATRRRSREAIGAIARFAELEDFLEAPVRTYSEGMKLRLAFGVVAQLRPPALLMDEVLAVGDIGFQQKCLDRVQEFREDGTAVVFASHDLETIESECDRVVWLDGGTVRAQGDPEEVVASYRDEMMSATRARTPAPEGPLPENGALTLRRNRFGSQELQLDGVSINGEGAFAAIKVGGALAMRCEVVVRDRSVQARARLTATIIRRADGLKCCESRIELGAAELSSGRTTLELALERLELAPGEYDVELGLFTADWAYAYDLHSGAYTLEVTGSTERPGVFLPATSWRVDGDPSRRGSS